MKGEKKKKKIKRFITVVRGVSHDLKIVYFTDLQDDGVPSILRFSSVNRDGLRIEVKHSMGIIRGSDGDHDARCSSQTGCTEKYKSRLPIITTLGLHFTVFLLKEKENTKYDIYRLMQNFDCNY